MINERIRFHFERVVGFYLHVSGKLQQAIFLIVNGSIRNDLVWFVAGGWKYLQVDLFQLVMTIGVGHVARCSQPEI